MAGLLLAGVARARRAGESKGGLHVNDWSTIEAIAASEGVDLWVLFPLGQTVNRWLSRNRRRAGSSLWCHRAYGRCEHRSEQRRLVFLAQARSVEVQLEDYAGPRCVSERETTGMKSSGPERKA